MKYTKAPLTFEQQADLLISRGLQAEKQELVEKLEVVNYYRLSGYWYPFKNSDDTFKPNTTLKKVWRRYTFDRQLRLIALDAIERVEISVRTNLVYYHSHRYGAWGYTCHENLPGLTEDQFADLIRKLISAKKRSRDTFVVHFNAKYGNRHCFLPLWMGAEIITLGMTLTMFRGVENKIKQDIAQKYGIPDVVLLSWLVALNTIRNVCAHHGRLRDRALDYTPKIPRGNKYPQWNSSVVIPKDRVFGILTILKYMMDIIAPQSKWDQRLIFLIDKYREIPLEPMGFPENWQDCPIWR